MDMAPRWDEGYGFQVRHALYGSDTLMDGEDEITNPLGLKRYVNTSWLEGVYTFDRSIRATFKLPYIDQRRTKNIGGVGVRQSNSGLGDLILGLPLKMNTSTLKIKRVIFSFQTSSALCSVILPSRSLT